MSFRPFWKGVFAKAESWLFSSMCGRGPVAFQVIVGPSRHAIELESRAAPSCLQRPPHSLPTLFALKTLLNSETNVRSPVRAMSAIMDQYERIEAVTITG